ncbi:peptidase domain-containing ABC transporter [Pseudocolwellia agarivorans]|uniref:peptidase domain-containing ABC transporter n=1 Tax=Pseudocolwellia agarivorans TaxID=1911682 RepID=UPI0009850B6C|nr:peptidase domain-containing ABC transporter [Pseudocolwellia agarivorans]
MSGDSFKLLNFNDKRKLPSILQSEASECGLACLSMISSFYGNNSSLNTNRQHYPVSIHGINLKQLIDIASKMNFTARAVKLDSDQVVNLPTPCILHWDLKHFVVLKKVSGNQFTIHDPAKGVQRLNLKEFNKHFTGVALELTPTNDFDTAPVNEKKLKIRDLWGDISGLKRSLLQILVLSLLLQIFGIISPFYMQTVVDDVLLRNDTNLLITLAIGFSLLLMIQVGTTVLRDHVTLYLSNRLSIQMVSNLFRHLIRLPIDYYVKRHIGDTVSRFNSQEKVRNILTNTIVAVFIDGLLGVITLIVMFFYDIKLTLIVVIIVVLYALVRWIHYHPFKVMTEESIVSKAKQDSHFIESVRAIQTLKMFQSENDRQGQWQNLVADTMNKNIKIAKWNIGYDSFNKLLFGFENILVVYFAAQSVMFGGMSLGMLFAFMSYKNRFTNAMNSLINQWISIKMLDLHLSRLADIALTPVEKISNNLSNLHDTPSIKGKIEVRNLSYRYSETEPYVFDNVSFVINAGENVAITGTSGCGKSTLLKCLMGLLEPTKGEILIDDVPLKKIPDYRSQISGVMQDEQLLNGSIFDNVACFETTPHLKKVHNSCYFSAIHREIEAMPMQYETLVGDMGAGLSGGQKQRIVMARALYRQPKILFMDEATSNLDVKTELVVNNNLRNLAITRVLVAHRPETVKSAERQINLTG